MSSEGIDVILMGLVSSPETVVREAHLAYA
jgi:methylmalonyl-CoA mutase cobalamin-binding subunit